MTSSGESFPSGEDRGRKATPRGAGDLLGPAVVALVFVALAALSWRRWADLHMDFGLTLYDAWQVSQGCTFYKDIAYLHGPLSNELNGLLFGVFGVSLLTLALANMTFLALDTALIYSFCSKLTDRFSATCVAAIFLVVFGFGAIIPAGNYNYVCPYAPEIPHAVLLSLVLVRALAWPSDKLVAPVVAGVCLGLVFLTKGEVFLAAAAAAAVGLALLVAARRASGRGALAPVLAFVLAASVPPAIAYALLRRGLPADEALVALLGTWSSVSRSRGIHDPFFQSIRGTDAPARHALEIVCLTGRTVLLVAAAALRARAQGLTPGPARRRTLGLALGALVAGIVSGGLDPSPGAALPPWLLVGQPLPVLAGVAAAWLAVRAWRSRRDAAALGAQTPVTIAVAFALGLFPKMLLNAQLYHYGFVLAMPATLLLVGALVGWAPRALERRGASGRTFRALVLLLLALDVAVYAHASVTNFRAKSLLVGRGGDALYTPPDKRGEIFARALERLGGMLPPEGTIATLPEGIMLDYQLRRRNPIPFINLNPFELAIWGERSVADALASHPPDLIVLTDVDESGFGHDSFGKDPLFGRELMAWIRAHYERAELFGSEPLVGAGYWIEVLRPKR